MISTLVCPNFDDWSRLFESWTADIASFIPIPWWGTFHVQP